MAATKKYPVEVQEVRHEALVVGGRWETFLFWLS